MRTVVVVVSFAASACSKSPSSEPPREVSPAPLDAAVGRPLPPVAEDAAARSPGACAADADCALFSSYCGDAPCTCFVLAKSEPKKKCSGGTVTCFVDPCMKKVARCRSGACVVAAE